MGKKQPQRRKHTPEYITQLNENEIFVFGSNLEGMHGGGAAHTAVKYFGAVMGQGTGLQGQSYAIPTMQGGVETIRPYVNEFVKFAQSRPDLFFYVTRIGCGIAGFQDKEIAPLFKKAHDLPNVALPIQFCYYIKNSQSSMDYIDKNKESILELLRSTQREGIEDVIAFMENSEFFIREASKKHHNYRGGLAEHSLETYKKAMALNVLCDKKSIIICSIFHDLCKISHRFTPHECYNGHGSRSVGILDFLKFQLKDDERRAIRFHASIKNRSFNDEDTEQLYIAKEETLRNLIALSVRLDINPLTSLLFPILKPILRLPILSKKL